MSSTQLGAGTVVFGDGTTQSTAGVVMQAGGSVFEIGQTVSSNYTVTSGKNAFAVGPLTINSGVTITVPTGSRFVII
jgi:hypothetical protein